ncbi:MAG: helix-turn-helix domain-containing protein [Candidatus Roizmanbacteria bacterium]|nr:helix-turn-helix domain-containing protein [Candidatus Roizmanbacteria bacterium]
MSATLGGLLKDFRLQKNISQLEISFAVGWKEPSRLSRIEQGRVGRPKRELLERIMDAMKLDEEERGRMFLAGGYLPTDKEITSLRKKLEHFVMNWEFPIVVYDFSWRVVYQNKAADRLYEMDKIFNGIQGSHHPNILEVLFNEAYSQTVLFKDKKDYTLWSNHLTSVLVQFMFTHRNRTKEKWYTDLIKKMMNNNLFRDHWEKAQSVSYASEIVNYYQETDIASKDSNIRLTFNLFTAPVQSDPRFEIEFHTPADLETFKYFEKK